MKRGRKEKRGGTPAPLFDRLEFLFWCAADRAFLRDLLCGHIAADLADVVGPGGVFDHVVEGALIEFGMVGFRVPGVGEGNGGGLLAVLFGRLYEIRVFVFTDGLLAFKRVEK